MTLGEDDTPRRIRGREDDAPGCILHGLREAGVRNPVFLLEAIDRAGPDLAEALRDVLDPVRGIAFEDQYLQVPFDLSAVLWIVTATDPEAIPEPVRNRLEVIELPGYTEQEKLAIAEQHLLKRPFDASVPGSAACLAPEPAAPSPRRGTGRRPGRSDGGGGARGVVAGGAGGAVGRGAVLRRRCRGVADSGVRGRRPLRAGGGPRGDPRPHGGGGRDGAEREAGAGLPAGAGAQDVLHRAARAAAPAYTELCEQVRNAPVVTPDETGWRVGGERHWLWTFVTPETTVYAICAGRGFADAATVLGTDYVGVLVRDGWAPYRCYDGLHQTCLNHLLQRCKQLREDYPDSPWAGEVQAVLRAGLDLRDRCNAGELSEHGMATARGRLTARLARLVDAPPPLDDAERFAAHLATEFQAVFLFLWDPSLDATNWRAEQAIRPAVVIRKVCGGNRTRHGADTQQVLASVVRTARQRGLDLPPLITAMLRAAEPVVPELLGLPPPPA